MGPFLRFSKRSFGTEAIAFYSNGDESFYSLELQLDMTFQYRETIEVVIQARNDKLLCVCMYVCHITKDL